MGGRGALPRADGFCAAFAALFLSAVRRGGAAQNSPRPAAARPQARRFPFPRRGKGTGGEWGETPARERRDRSPHQQPTAPAAEVRGGTQGGGGKQPGTRRAKPAAPPAAPERSGEPPRPPDKAGGKAAGQGEPPRRRPRQRKGGQSPPGLTLALPWYT